MKLFLAIDFGSTYTKLNLFDLERPLLLAQAQSHTTIETSILFGFQNAFQELQKQFPISLEEIPSIRVCSSAAGGLQISVIGIVPNLTLEAAKKAALGAGGKIIASFAFFLQKQEIEVLESNHSDIILLAGGSNGGNTEIVLHNARLLADSTLDCPIVYCGNEKIQQEVSKILQHKKIYCVKNIMPDVNELDVEECREKIRELFYENIIQAKGLEEICSLTPNHIVPTPAAVLSCLSLFEEKEPVMMIDIGGATTDVHSFSKKEVFEENCFLESLKEPKYKRTVEGDLGMRYSALSTWEKSSHIPSFLSQSSWKESCTFRQEHPSFIPQNEIEAKIDEALAQVCVSYAVERHVGRLRSSYNRSEKMLVQRGKDFRTLQYLIGTGGVLIHSPHAKEILQAALQTEGEESILKPMKPNFLLDQHYLASALGMLAETEKEIAKKLVEKYFVTL